MATLSPAREEVLTIPELELVRRGKVRDVYDLDGTHLLIVTSDAISIFDFVLNALVPQKGAILTAMNIDSLQQIEETLQIPTHLVAFGADVDNYLPHGRRNDPYLQARSMVVRNLKMVPIEFIARGYLTGSGLTTYLQTGSVCGHVLPPGLQDGDELLQAIDTPTTKSETGHDEDLDAAVVREEYPTETEWLMHIYAFAHEWALSQGVVLADTKLEFGHDPSTGELYVADEAITLDSSRFWDYGAWRKSRDASERRAPTPQDKQLARNWGRSMGINKLDSKNPADVERVHRMEVPQKLIENLQDVYAAAFRLRGMPIEEFWQHMMGIQDIAAI